MKSERIKDLGSPIQLPGVALDIHIRGKFAWIAENTAVVRKVDLEVAFPFNVPHFHSLKVTNWDQTSKTVQLFRGHTAPTTAIAFYDKVPGSGDEGLLISGSWDKVGDQVLILSEILKHCIEYQYMGYRGPPPFIPSSLSFVETSQSKRMLSSTPAHADFVKSLLVIPSLCLLVSTSSDKIVRFWYVRNMTTHYLNEGLSFVLYIKGPFILRGRKAFELSRLHLCSYPSCGGTYCSIRIQDIHYTVYRRHDGHHQSMGAPIRDRTIS